MRMSCLGRMYFSLKLLVDKSASCQTPHLHVSAKSAKSQIDEAGQQTTTSSSSGESFSRRRWIPHETCRVTLEVSSESKLMPCRPRVKEPASFGRAGG